MNKSIKPNFDMTKKIVEEINSKIQNYEGRMSQRLSRWTDAAELYSCRTSTSKENSKVSSNSVELFKSIRAISNMQVRMLTSQSPYFELEPLDILGAKDHSKIIKSEHYVSKNLELSKFKKGLLRALTQINLYGSVAIHEQYEPLRASFLGRKRYITSYRPISLVNCAFSLDAYDIEESEWVAITDIQGKRVLHQLKSHDIEGNLYNMAGLDSAINQKDYCPKVNNWVTQRMAWAGYQDGNFDNGIERSNYYGPLDCMNDGEMYAVEVVNREFIIRMEAYDGITPVRIATINTLDVEPLGNGLGDQFRPLLGQIDNVRVGLLNSITLAGANMFAKQKALSEEDMEFAIRNFGIVNLENPNLQSIAPDPRTIAELASYEDRITQQYRQGSGATDTLQALVSGDNSTATEVSLAMNEAVRNISVASEILAPTLIGDHVKVILQNGQKYQTKPFTLTINKVPMVVNPADLLIDVDVNVKTMTDSNFRPAKVNKLIQTLGVMASAGPNAIPGHKINIGPTLLEILRLQDVPSFDATVTELSEDDILQMAVMAQMQGQVPGAGGSRIGTYAPTPNASKDINTPAGPVMSAPNDSERTRQAIASSNAEVTKPTI